MSYPSGMGLDTTKLPHTCKTLPDGAERICAGCREDLLVARVRELEAGMRPEDVMAIQSRAVLAEARIASLEAALAAEVARTDALVSGLPLCLRCGAIPATRMSLDGEETCDRCDPDRDQRYGDTPLAAPLRAIAEARRLAGGG